MKDLEVELIWPPVCICPGPSRGVCASAVHYRAFGFSRHVLLLQIGGRSPPLLCCVLHSRIHSLSNFSKKIALNNEAFVNFSSLQGQAHVNCGRAIERHFIPYTHAYDISREARRGAHLVQSPRAISSHSRRTLLPRDREAGRGMSYH